MFDDKIDNLTPQEAKAELASTWEVAGIKAQVSKPVFSTDPGSFADKGKMWPHFAYVVIFSDGKRNVSVDYNMGASVEEECGFYAKNLYIGNGSLSRKDAKRGHKVGDPAPSPDRKPNPAEVFACICSEALDARNQSFEDWADAFGYDKDSRTAEKIYRLCCDRYHELTSITTPKMIERFATLSTQL